MIYAALADTGPHRLGTVAPHHLADVRRLVFDRLDDARTEALGNIAAALDEQCSR